MTRILSLRCWSNIPTIDLMHVWPDVHIMKFGIILRSAKGRKGRGKNKMLLRFEDAMERWHSHTSLKMDEESEEGKPPKIFFF